MRYMVIDTETNGLPQDFKAPIEDTKNWPRIVSIAWITPGFTKYYLIQPQRRHGKPFEIENSHIHGITKEMCVKYGTSLKLVLKELLRDARRCSMIVAHNTHFDASVIGCELYRCKLPALNMPLYCTMINGAPICKIPPAITYKGDKPGFKWPSLVELAKHFEIPFEANHNALSDAQVCQTCFLMMTKLSS
jgi:DNA polymerase III subunit alpha